MTLLLLLALLSLAGSVVLTLRARATARDVRASLARAAGLAAGPPARSPLPRGRRFPFAARLGRVALVLRPGVSGDAIALRLASAGLARRVSAEAYLALQGSFVVAGVVFGLLLAAAGSPSRALLVALLLLAGGLVLPDRVVASRATRRQDLVLAELPGALDLLAIAVEAGLGFDAALARVIDAIEGPLAQELNLMLAEIRVGEARQSALQRLADRVGVADVATFARAVARADQLGTSLAQTLRMQAADARARRQLAAEEKAGKAPVKMLFPTVVFILPALFVVVLGPAVMSLSRFL